MGVEVAALPDVVGHDVANRLRGHQGWRHITITLIFHDNTNISQSLIFAQIVNSAGLTRSPSQHQTQSGSPRCLDPLSSVLKKMTLFTEPFTEKSGESVDKGSFFTRYFPKTVHQNVF